MRILLIGLILLLPVVAWGQDTKLEGRSIIYKDQNTRTGAVFMVKTTNEKNTYFWYIQDERCVATAFTKDSRVNIKCNSGTIVAELDAGDLKFTERSNTKFAPKGSLLYGMFTAIMTDASKSSTKLSFAAEAKPNKYDDLEKYFPLKKGNFSKYILLGDTEYTDEQKTESCDEKKGNGYSCLIGSMSPFFTGVYVYEIRGKQLICVSSLDTNRKLLERNNVVLQSPLIKNKSWSYIEDNLVKHVLKVVDVLPKYTVKAGEYNDVIKIEKKSYWKDKKTNKFKTKPVGPGYEYYAANVGFIKAEWLEKNNEIKVLRELVEFNGE